MSVDVAGGCVPATRVYLHVSVHLRACVWTWHGCLCTCTTVILQYVCVCVSGHVALRVGVYLGLCVPCRLCVSAVGASGPAGVMLVLASPRQRPSPRTR